MKRFKITGGGKVMRGKQYGRHKRASKSRRRIRTFKKMVELTSHEAKLVKELI